MSIELDLSFWEIFWSIVFVLGVGFVSGRILGVRRGFLRATVAGLIGSFIGLVIATIVLRDEAEITGEEIIPLAFGFALLATMVLSVVLEVLLRPRRRVKRASLRTRIKTFFTVGGRLFEVSRIARRNGLAGPGLTSRAALSSPEGGLRIRRFLEDCGGMFIKFGQIASTRSDLLPAPVLAELSDLQSNVKKVPIDADPGQASRASWARRSRRSSSRSPTNRWPPHRSARPTSRCCRAGSGWWSRSAVPMSRSASPGTRRCCAGPAGQRSAGRRRRGSSGWSRWPTS